MLATDDPKFQTPAQVALATGQRGTLEAQTKNPASDQGHQAIGTGAARQMAGDVGRAPMPLPSAPAGSASENLGGYTPTGRAGVYRQGNSFTDEAGTRGAIQTSGPVGRTAAQAVMTSPSVPSPQPVGSNAASTLAAGLGDNQQALARLQAANPTQAQAPVAAPRGFDANRAASALTDLRSPQYIALRNAAVGGITRSGYNALFNELTAGARQAQTAEMQDAGQTQRTGMQEAGATGRTALTEGGNMARAIMTNGVQQGELALKQESAGIANSAAQQLAEVQQSYLNAKTPQERAQAAQAIRVLTGKGDAPTPPTGYRWAADGNLQAIPGGPGDKTQQGKPMPTAAASGLLGNRENLRRAENALSLLNGEQLPGGAGGDPNATGLKGYLPNQVLNRVDPKGVDTRAAIADLGSLIINDRSGAAVTAAEFPRLAPFIPTEKDDPATARKKLDQFVKNFKANIDDTTEFYRQLGYAVPDFGPTEQQTQAPPQGGQPPISQPQLAKVPQAGEVRQGYLFKGGNPADKANWEPAR